jgi:hypothetical protein
MTLIATSSNVDNSPPEHSSAVLRQEKADSNPIELEPAQFNEFYRQCSRRLFLRRENFRP